MPLVIVQRRKWAGHWPAARLSFPWMSQKVLYLGFGLLFLVPVPTVGVSHVRVPSVIECTHGCFWFCPGSKKIKITNSLHLKSPLLSLVFRHAVIFLLTAYDPILQRTPLSQGCLRSSLVKIIITRLDFDISVFPSALYLPGSP